ncbi:unnamed protein product [Vicia faba]|uniref:E2 ubiquitin-conjugating enzyme n=1 Tax=Vicia faba TaxID=3906 RepID=A0AAV0YY61_VICFA|nr:unnamed protein product [Vicia faba]
MEAQMTDSDWESSSESSSSDDQEDIDFLYGGQAQSILSSLEESIGKIDDFLSFERTFAYGDVVRSLSDTTGQMGRVVGVDVAVDLENVQGSILKNVNSKKLLKIRSISEGDYVIKGPWLGQVQRVVDRLTVLFDDGTKYDITTLEKDKILPQTPNFLEDSQYPYYPGQRVKVKSSTGSKSARWLCDNWRDNHDEGTVCSVEAAADQKEQIEKMIRDSPDGYLPNTYVTLGSDPQNLIPVNVINTHEFWPHQFVMEKGTSEDDDDDDDKDSNQRWGVVLSVDAEEHTVNVQWRTVLTSEPDDLAGEPTLETVSAYELVEHPDFSCCFGDIVFKTAQKQVGYRAEKNNANSMSDLNVEVPLIKLNQINYHNKSKDNCHLSCIGNVSGFKDGHVEVKWATGLTTKVAPYEIFRIDKHESSTATPVSYETNVADLTQDKCDKHPGESSSFSLPQAAFELFSNIKAGVFQKLGLTSFYGAVSTVPTFEEGNASDFLGKKDLETCSLDTNSHPVSSLQSAEVVSTSIHETRDVPVSLNNNCSDQLKQFDIIDTCSDHHFFNEGKGLPLSQVKKDWVKKVQQEWSILEKNVPETIYVRVFEERMDLMRAVIVGASGTPYHDGLFFFDVCFPPEYPSEPPIVHYISGGLRINPNLYESGKVCLSLLNTWSGTAAEVWNPGSSTVLQVLLSLQALVLNEKPYFNEAGYDQQIGRAEGEKNSVSYNENAFLLTSKSMLYLLRNPPKHFEALVEEHFRQRAKHILNACKAYLEGASIAGEKSEHENQKGTSAGFKIMLAKLFPKLVEAFSGKGIDCSQFVDMHK